VDDEFDGYSEEDRVLMEFSNAQGYCYEGYSPRMDEIGDWWYRGLISTRELGDRLRRLGQEPL
jgi:hypothetical protein